MRMEKISHYFTLQVGNLFFTNSDFFKITDDMEGYTIFYTNHKYTGLKSINTLNF